MKTIRNVHIAKQPFFIEDDAYALLDHYLEKIKTQFNSDEAQELTTDVELRIVELLSDHAINKGDVIPVDVVTKIIDQIGELDDSLEDKESEEKEGDDVKTVSTGKKKLFLDMKNGKIRGVCYGLGSYFGISPTIIRAIFVLPIILPLLNLFTPTTNFFEMVFSTITAGLVFGGIYILISNIVPYAQTEFDRAAMHGTSTSISEVFKAINTSEVKEKSATAISKVEDFFVGGARFVSSSLRKISRAFDYLLAAVFLCAAGIGLFALGMVAFSDDASIKRNLPVTLTTSDRVVIIGFIVLAILWSGSIALALISFLRKKTKLLTKIMIFCGVLILFSATLVPFGIVKGTSYANKARKAENTKIGYKYDVDNGDTLTIETGEGTTLNIYQSKDSALNIDTNASKSLSKSERLKFDTSSNKLTIAADVNNLVCTTCKKYQEVKLEVPVSKKVVKLVSRYKYASASFNVSSNFLNGRTLISGDSWVSVDSFPVGDEVDPNQLLDVNVEGSNAMSIFNSNIPKLNIARISSSVPLVGTCIDCAQNESELRQQMLMPEKANEIYIDAPDIEKICMLFPATSEETTNGIYYSSRLPDYQIILNGTIYQGESLRPLMCKL